MAIFLSLAAGEIRLAICFRLAVLSRTLSALRVCPVVAPWLTVALLTIALLSVALLSTMQDSSHDWHSQVSEMAAIYENAAITISAVSSDVHANNGRIFSQNAVQNTLQNTVELNLHNGSKVFIREWPVDAHPFTVFYHENTYISHHQLTILF
jgi:hypothetical protein